MTRYIGGDWADPVLETDFEELSDDELLQLQIEKHLEEEENFLQVSEELSEDENLKLQVEKHLEEEENFLQEIKYANSERDD